MTFPKLSPVQWITLCAKLYPLLAGFVKLSKMSYVAAIRYLLEIMGNLQDMFPEAGSGALKVAELARIIRACFATEDEEVPAEVSKVVNDVSTAAGMTKTYAKAWGFFKSK